MPAGVADFGAGAWVSALFGVTSDITTYYIALCDDEPGPAMDGTILAGLEPTDTAYARQSYSAGASNWGVNTNAVVTLNDIDFGVPTVDWGVITHFALVTAAVDGDLYAWGEFQSPQYISASFSVLVPAGGIVLALSSVTPSIAI